MSRITLRLAALAALMPLFPGSLLAQTGPPSNAERGWSSVARCAQEDSERARHTCLDQVLRDAGLLTDEMHARQQRRAFGLDDQRVPASPPTPPSTTPDVSGATDAPPARPASPAPQAASAQSPAPAAPDQPDRLEVGIASVQKTLDGRLLVTTTEGAVWLQTETVDMPRPPVAGDRMTIRKGAMAGYRCSLATTHLTYRCARSR
jgi:pyruvate/2-oxoglutarate dehydrogenase complex dihydrolipoamide acyltransferase (E2) component